MPPSPLSVVEAVTAFQRTAAVKTALELGVFTAIADGYQTSTAVATECECSPRGARMLCDYLVTAGFLAKQGTAYTLSSDAAAFLNRRSPAYIGGIAEFLASPTVMAHFADLTRVVRDGTLATSGTMAPDHPVWIEFARGMASLMKPAAEIAADLVSADQSQSVRAVLDVAAGHGMFGIALARRFCAARVVALDWPDVLAVARENAAMAGVGARYHGLPGNAFEVDWGGDYDIVLFANFLHHFGRSDCISLLARARASLADAGRVVVYDLVPDEDRVTPSYAASFALMMLGTTPSGDAYTFDDYAQMFDAAGFARCEVHAIVPTGASLLIATCR